MKDIYVQQMNFLLYLCSTDQRNQFKRARGGRYITYVVCVNIKYSTRTDRPELKCSSVTPERLHGLESVQIPYSLSCKEMEISCELNVFMTVFSLCLNENPWLLPNRVVERDLRYVMDWRDRSKLTLGEYRDFLKCFPDFNAVLGESWDYVLGQ